MCGTDTVRLPRHRRGNNANGTADYTFTPGGTAPLTVIEPHGNNVTVVEVYQKR